MKGKRIACVTCLLSVLLVFIAFDVQSATWIVKSDGTGDAPSIQAALNSASPGDTILVSAGLYVENSIFCNKDDLTLMSVDGPEHTFLEDTEAPPPILTLAGLSGFTLKGFTLQNSVFNAMDVYMCSDVLIEDNIFLDNNFYAVIVELGSNVTIRNCLFCGNSSGMHVMGTGCVVEGNTVSHNGGYGVYLSSGDFELRNNLIAYNDVGVATDVGTTFTASCNNVFSYSNNYEATPDLTGINGNISVDPQYCAVDPLGSLNFWIQSDSPCSPGNHPDGFSCDLIGKYPVGCGPTSVEEKSWGAIKELYK
jgi:parallel beta-helix repeat protein